MQGQRSAFSSLPDSINIDYGSLPNDAGVDEQILWNNLSNPTDSYTGNVVEEGQNLRRWGFSDLSSTNPQNQVNHDEQMTQTGWSPSLNTIPGVSSRLEERAYESANPVSQAGVDLNLSSNQIYSGPMSSAFHNQNINMDYPSSSKSVRVESKTLASTSSDPFASSSGSGGFLLEEDDDRPGCSMDGRRLSCKRKTLEGNVGPMIEGGMYNAGTNLHVSESSSSIGPTPQVNPNLGLNLSGRIPSNSFRPMNFTMNMPHQQDSTPCFTVPDALSRHPDISPVQPFIPLSSHLNLMPPIPPPPDNSDRQNQPVMVRVPALRRNIQSSRWNGGPNFRPGSSSGSAMSSERDNVVPGDSNPRNAPRSIVEHLMHVPPPSEGRNSTQTVSNWGMSGGNVGISRSVASTSRMVSYRHPQSHYSRRLSEYVRRSLMSTDASLEVDNNNQHHLGVGSSSQESMYPTSAVNDIHTQPRSSSVAWRDRHGDDVVGFPHSLRALAAAGEGRSRLVSEIRNALDIMRRGEGLRFEDVMVLDQSVFFGMADIHDQHRDMRLDVDNMSYEELLALEERIGNVCTGLSEETILKRMKQRKFIHTIDGDHIDTEPCCVCQETYKDGEDLGTLDCGHDFHRECIKQWLAQKNLCPICKTTALAT